MVRVAVIGGCGVMVSVHRSAVGSGASGIETMCSNPAAEITEIRLRALGGSVSRLPLSSNNRAFQKNVPAVIVACMQLSEATDPLTGETDFLHLSVSLWTYVDGDARVASRCQGHRSNSNCYIFKEIIH